jgi:hypothetical protein
MAAHSAGEGRIGPASGEAARASALWSRRKRTGLAAALALTLPALAAGNAQAAAYVAPDLLAQAKESRYFNQYCPGQTQWLCRPGDLPATDLTFAFVQG